MIINMIFILCQILDETDENKRIKVLDAIEVLKGRKTVSLDLLTRFEKVILNVSQTFLFHFKTHLRILIIYFMSQNHYKLAFNTQFS